MTSDFMKAIEKGFGEEGMKRPPSRREMYEAIAVIKSALLDQQGRIDALDGRKEGKPVVRVRAGRKGA